MTSIKDHFSAFKESLKNNYSKLTGGRSYHYYFNSEVKKALEYDKLPSLLSVTKITSDDRYQTNCLHKGNLQGS